MALSQLKYIGEVQNGIVFVSVYFYRHENVDSDLPLFACHF